ncbi:CoA-binding protein [Rhodocytophaga aerolata]|uniref:CoA-binding protein n=1 Tax=Rhodocytophaga aerolata TaxID=455078 RepID=A0ABT8R3T1_9BACT|nr:CoA-binding protein [Rhodocytophaga aerolata]MDO1446766.1 CoA-binding protein [Rhodocytophaga aerolata]
MKKTVVLGATDNPERFAYRAAHSLVRHGYEIAPVGIKQGTVAGKDIINDKKVIPDVHTVTLYVGSRNLPEWYDYILSLNPKRIIFNPGTENDELMRLANEKGIQTIEGCTLVMLSAGMY